ncbi:MAG: glyoxylase-like metal-dependent hydrolase (beta-lactamase superfamily II) [Gammaproteobacteria bacterium]|jgi:glyoxylase-like metal-dependent hydrolase (beta-lactamase superfamily II)
MMDLADRWFDRTTISNDITLIREPHVDELLRCNIWHIKGRDCDLLVDTGMGICSLKDEIEDLLGKPVIVVATHSHLDHMGSMYEFDTRVIHHCEADILAFPPQISLDINDWPIQEIKGLQESGYALKNERLITALPRVGFDLHSFHTPAAVPTRLVDEGDVIDLGNRHFQVLHLPGHSPGSIGLWEEKTGTLFSGDAIYDGPLLDTGGDSNIEDYLKTMDRLQNLPVNAVHGGHDESFDRSRLKQITAEYIAHRGKQG